MQNQGLPTFQPPQVSAPIIGVNITAKNVYNFSEYVHKRKRAKRKRANNIQFAGMLVEEQRVMILI